MDPSEVERHWEANAEAWTVLSRAGHDRCRDLFNTPTFLEILPLIDGLRGLDIGCGEGHNTRLLAGRGARMSGVDLAPTFIRHAHEREREQPLSIDFQVASGDALPFADASFDFATAFMSLQDMVNQEQAFAEAFRVLRPGGFLQFSITHPCFQTPKWEWVHDENGRRVAMKVGDYFDRGGWRVDEWIWGSAPLDLRPAGGNFKIPYFERTLSGWMNLILAAGFSLEAFAEPTPTDAVLAEHPGLCDARIVAYFLIVRCRKPAR